MEWCQYRDRPQASEVAGTKTENIKNSKTSNKPINSRKDMLQMTILKNHHSICIYVYVCIGLAKDILLILKIGSYTKKSPNGLPLG